jgi:hypothetical protein
MALVFVFFYFSFSLFEEEGLWAFQKRWTLVQPCRSIHI